LILSVASHGSRYLLGKPGWSILTAETAQEFEYLIVTRTPAVLAESMVARTSVSGFMSSPVGFGLGLSSLADVASDDVADEY